MLWDSSPSRIAWWAAQSRWRCMWTSLCREHLNLTSLLRLLMLTPWEKDILPCLLLLQLLLLHLFFTISIFLLNNCRKYSFESRHVPSKLGKTSSTKTDILIWDTLKLIWLHRQTHCPMLQEIPWAKRCCFDLPLLAAMLSNDRTCRLLTFSFCICSWCIQVIEAFYLLEPFFFFLKGNVLMLSIETHGSKLLQDNTWWASASWGKGSLSSTCDMERCLMLTSWLIPLIWCLSGTVLCLPCRGKCRNLFVTFLYAERAQRRKGSLLWVVRNPVPLILFMGFPFPSEWKEC